MTTREWTNDFFDFDWLIVTWQQFVWTTWKERDSTITTFNREKHFMLVSNEPSRIHIGKIDMEGQQEQQNKKHVRLSKKNMEHETCRAAITSGKNQWPLYDPSRWRMVHAKHFERCVFFGLFVAVHLGYYLLKKRRAIVICKFKWLRNCMLGYTRRWSPANGSCRHILAVCLFPSTEQEGVDGYPIVGREF